MKNAEEREYKSRPVSASSTERLKGGIIGLLFKRLELKPTSHKCIVYSFRI